MDLNLLNFYQFLIGLYVSDFVVRRTVQVQANVGSRQHSDVTAPR